MMNSFNKCSKCDTELERFGLPAKWYCPKCDGNFDEVMSLGGIVMDPKLERVPQHLFVDAPIPMHSTRDLVMKLNLSSAYGKFTNELGDVSYQPAFMKTPWGALNDVPPEVMAMLDIGKPRMPRAACPSSLHDREDGMDRRTGDDVLWKRIDELLRDTCTLANKNIALQKSLDAERARSNTYQMTAHSQCAAIYRGTTEIDKLRAELDECELAKTTLIKQNQALAVENERLAAELQEQIENYPADIETPVDDSLMTFIRDCERRFFRTNEDTGANEHARLILNVARGHAGLPSLKKSDLPSWDGKEYAMPKDSKLLANTSSIN